MAVLAMGSWNPILSESKSKLLPFLLLFFPNRTWESKGHIVDFNPASQGVQVGYIEVWSSSHKTRSAGNKIGLPLPLVAPVKGFSEHLWGKTFIEVASSVGLSLPSSNGSTFLEADSCRVEKQFQHGGLVPPCGSASAFHVSVKRANCLGAHLVGDSGFGCRRSSRAVVTSGDVNPQKKCKTAWKSFQTLGI